MKPSIGRIVHYWDGDLAEPSPAIITKVWSDECINLKVFRDGVDSSECVTSVPLLHEAKLSMFWSWPERV